MSFEHSDLGALIDSLKAFFLTAAQPPPGSTHANDAKTIARWRDAVWTDAFAAIENAEAGRSWWELEDEPSDSPAYVALLRNVFSLGAKRNWLAAVALGRRAQTSPSGREMTSMTQRDDIRLLRRNS